VPGGEHIGGDESPKRAEKDSRSDRRRALSSTFTPGVKIVGELRGTWGGMKEGRARSKRREPVGELLIVTSCL
jgi:hypothetical protein